MCTTIPVLGFTQGNDEAGSVQDFVFLCLA